MSRSRIRIEQERGGKTKQEEQGGSDKTLVGSVCGSRERRAMSEMSATGESESKTG